MNEYIDRTYLLYAAAPPGAHGPGHLVAPRPGGGLHHPLRHHPAPLPGPGLRINSFGDII